MTSSEEYIQATEAAADHLTPDQIQANLDGNEDLNETERSVLREALERKTR
jgi:hypothetical protein